MDTLILLLATFGVIGTLMALAFTVGRASVYQDPYNFVQHKEIEEDEREELTRIMPAVSQEIIKRRWEEYLVNQPTKEMRSYK